MSLFKLRGELSNLQSIVLGIGGILFMLLIWFLITNGADPIVSHGILPKPIEVLQAYPKLFNDHHLFMNVCRSVGLNLAGYIEAIIIAIPLGFVIGLFPFFRGTFQGQVDAVRYIPLTAVTGLFIIWFGIGTAMKVHFLAFGILIYLLPVVVQRIDEVKSVYLKTVYTIGATDWQTIRSVYIPSVLSRLFDDIRVLTAISWTYIIIAESLGSERGIGTIIWKLGQRQGMVEITFAMLLIIIIIGMLQDKLFIYLDKIFFPFKNPVKHHKSKIVVSGTRTMIKFALKILGWTMIGLYLLFFVFEFTGHYAIEGETVLSYLFADTVNFIHLLFFIILFFQVKPLLKK